MIEYSTGLLFDVDEVHVVLINKLTPKWQEGLYNGVGGKLEPGETAEEAMRREFIEEAGVDISSWRKFAVLSGSDGRGDYRLHFFHAYEQYDVVASVRSITAEQVELTYVSEVSALETLPNLKWLVPMALALRDKSSTLGIQVLQ
jgi:8-oxo-dGTP diphosphatase